jgi:leader peptidase (prepilin peptidase)/N-methyltransferase
LGELIVGFFLGFAYGAMVAVALIALRKAGRKSTIPFGAFLVAGAFTAVLWGQDLSQLYVIATLG